jgi:hypothetical protein
MDEETLFLCLSVMHAEDNYITNYLVDHGYLTKELFLTIKAWNFKNEYINRFKIPILQTIKTKSSVSETMESIGIKNYRTFLILEDELVEGSPSLCL